MFFSHVPLRKIIYLFMFFICMHQYVTIHSKKQKSEVLFKKNKSVLMHKLPDKGGLQN